MEGEAITITLSDVGGRCTQRPYNSTKQTRKGRDVARCVRKDTDAQYPTYKQTTSQQEQKNLLTR